MIHTLRSNPIRLCRSRRSPRRGFTLSEVLIALGILAVGSVAVASLFPVGLLLQKETVDETLRQGHIRSIDALLLGNGLSNNSLLTFTDHVNQTPTFPANGLRRGTALPLMIDPGYDVFAVAEIDIDLSNTTDTDMRNGASAMTVNAADKADKKYRDADSYLANWPMSIRSLPTMVPPAASGTFAPDLNYSGREVFWVPLIRRGIEASNIYADWSVYAFVFQPKLELRTSGVYALANYDPITGGPDLVSNTTVCANPYDPAFVPKVFRVQVNWNPSSPNQATVPINLYGYLKPGDKVLGNNGKIYKVTQVSNEINSLITLSPEKIYSPINERDLGSLWIAPAPGGIQEDSPLVDIRLLSNSVVRVDSIN